MLTRRDLLKHLGVSGALLAAPGLALANARTDARFVLVILRGAADGLSIAAPYGDPAYSGLRGELALLPPGRKDGVMDLDGFFGLHPRLTFTHERFTDREASVIHAVASPYRERSHFDGQDVLENGGSIVGAMRDGWLNRALKPLGGNLGDEPAIALAQNTPLVLRGPQSVTSWAPSRLPDADEDIIERLRLLYAEDAFFSMRLEQAIRSQEIAEGMDGARTRNRGNGAEALKANLKAAANFLTTPDGPGIAVVEAGGWDTHANQGAARGALANQLGALDAGLAELHAGLGATWKRTVVAVVTEFGRTAKVNGTRGTDHGTASAALLLGGAVNGGKVVADWPGLKTSALFESRDLYPTLDLRAVFKGILAEHLELAPAYIDREVFPGSAKVRPLNDIVNA